MKRLGRLPPTVVSEDETFGDFMEEMAKTKELAFLLRRLWSVRDRVSNDGASSSFLLERFHPSYYALLPTWAAYEELDAQLAALGVSVVLLWVNEESIRER